MIVFGSFYNYVENKHFEVPVKPGVVCSLCPVNTLSGALHILQCIFGIVVLKSRFVRNFVRVLQKDIARFLSNAFLPAM